MSSEFGQRQDGGSAEGHHWNTDHTVDVPRRKRDSYLDAILVALAVWVVASLLLGIAVAIAAPATVGDVTAYGLLGLLALAVGIVVGSRYAKLSGWRAWLVVVLGSLVAMVGLASAIDMFGERVLWAYLGVVALYLWLGRRRDGATG